MPILSQLLILMPLALPMQVLVSIGALWREGFIFNFSSEVTHLGHMHIFSFDLSDHSDILRPLKDLNRKANSILCTFRSVDPFVKCFLLKSFCLSLYGCSLWSLFSSSIKVIEIALKKILRKCWNLPCNSPSVIVHCVAEIHTIFSLVYKCFHSLFTSAVSSLSPLVRSIVLFSSHAVYCFTSFNMIYGHRHCH